MAMFLFYCGVLVGSSSIGALAHYSDMLEAICPATKPIIDELLPCTDCSVDDLDRLCTRLDAVVRKCVQPGIKH